MIRTKTFMLLAVSIIMALPTKAITCENMLAANVFPITFNMSGIDPDNHDGPRRGPIVPPSVSIDGHTLYLYSGCADATLQVVDTQGVVVYSTEITDFIDEIELPETLSGEYELQIIRGNFCFYAPLKL